MRTCRSCSSIKPIPRRARWQRSRVGASNSSSSGRRGSGPIALTIVADEVVVGSIGSWDAEGERHVGYWIGREHWGKGYATAALRAFLLLDPRRPLLAHVVDHNIGSRRVLEKCGFVLERSQQEEDVVEHVFVLVDEARVDEARGDM